MRRQCQSTAAPGPFRRSRSSRATFHPSQTTLGEIDGDPSSITPDRIIPAAHAADLPQLPPVYAPPIEEYVASGWYLRGDIGITNQRLKKLDSNPAQQFPTTDHGLGFDSSGLFGLGVGYQFNDGQKIIRLEKVTFSDGTEMNVYGR